MSLIPNLPRDLIPHLTRILNAFGETVTYTSPDGAVTWSASASIQSPSPVPLLQDIDQEFFLVYVSAADVPAPPVNMGRVTLRGRPRSVESVVCEAPQGIPVYYMLRVGG